MIRLGQKGAERDRVFQRAVLAVALIWLPLLGLSLAQGVSVGPQVAPLLIDVKKRALFEYGALVTDHPQRFDAKWIRGDRPPGEVILGNPDPSSLADLGSAFAVVRDMSIPACRSYL